MREGTPAGMLVVVAVVACLAAGVHALQPPTHQELARAELATVVGGMGEQIAEALQGEEFSTATSSRTAGTVLAAANLGGRAVRRVGAGDDGRVTWVDLAVRTQYRREGAGLSSRLDLDVSGCVRWTVRHANAARVEDAAELTARSVPCPAGTPLPPPASREAAAAPHVRVDDLPRSAWPVPPARLPPCYSGTRYCPYGG